MGPRTAWTPAMRFRFRVYDTFFFGTAMSSRPSRRRSESEERAPPEEEGPGAASASSMSAGGGCPLNVAPSRCHTAHGPMSAEVATRLRSSQLMAPSPVEVSADVA